MNNSRNIMSAMMRKNHGIIMFTQHPHHWFFLISESCLISRLLVNYCTQKGGTKSVESSKYKPVAIIIISQFFSWFNGE
jgi:hypothetical protein